MIALSNRVHLFARPDIQGELTAFFTDILECEAAVLPGTPIVAFRFPNNASLSVEFTADALDEEHAGRGAWLEVQTDNPAALQRKILEAGLARVDYATGRIYFRAPGGQYGASFPSVNREVSDDPVRRASISPHSYPLFGPEASDGQPC